MDDLFVTICGISHYYGAHPLKCGSVLKIQKDFENPFDPDAIKASLPSLGTVGYIANSHATVIEGTLSASAIHPHIADNAFCMIMFKTENYVIGKII